MKLGFAGRVDVPERLKLARDAVDILGERADLVASPTLATALTDLESVPIREMDVDAMVTFGGDGTILYTLHRTNAPILGVNLGEMGFLTATEPRDMEQALERLLAGDYHVEERLKLAARLNDERLPDAANEVVLKTPRPAKVLKIQVRNREEDVLRIMADGIIVATPTGCTGYSLSAGGPLVDPRLDLLLVVPLADFRIMSRPLVYPPDEPLEVHLEEPGKDGILSVDGQVEREVTPDDVIRLERSDTPSRFVRFRFDFYDRIRDRFLERPHRVR